MIRNYLKIAFRNFFNNKVYSFINITGLAVGMAVALLIGLWLWDEISFNKYHTSHKHLAGVMSTTTFNGETSTNMFASVPLAAELRDKYPGDFKNVAVVSGGQHVLTSGNKNIIQQGMWAEAAFPAMFSFEITTGNCDALKDPSSLLIDRSVAIALFGKEDPVNKMVRVDNRIDLRVGGVYEDLPRNSSFYGLAFLLPWQTYLHTEPGMADKQNDWNNHHFQVFAELNDAIAIRKINDKIKDITKPHIAGNSYEEIFLHPMDQWYLYNEFRNGKKAGGRIQFVWLFGVAGILILMLACINFMNLSTARSEKRAKEVGIRKTMGSLRGQLIGQFLSESLLITFLSFILTILLVQLSLHFFNDLSGKQVTVPYDNPVFWLIALGFTFFTGLISGSYPAFYLSAFRPVKVLKGTFRNAKFAALPRRILVVVQFTISIALIAGTLIVYRQIQYARNRSVGYEPTGLITVSMKTPEIRNQYNALRDDLLRTGVVANMAESSSPTTNVVNDMMGFRWKGKDPNFVPLIGTISVTHDFGNTIGWQIKEGRDFSRQFPGDTGSLIMNEAAVRLTGFKNPVGETMHWKNSDRVIIGVVKDMVMESPFMPVRPTVFFLDYEWRTSFITLRLKNTVPLKKTLARIETVFKKYDPGTPFSYTFIDNEFDRKFYSEQQVSKLAGFFAALAIFISCLGLFGLASFVAEQRAREIGIRKVLGASVFNVWKLLSKEFAALVIISCGLATPVAWYFLNQWLQKYSYRITLSAWIFVLAGTAAICISLVTVSFQSIKVALTNPVKSLRTQ